MKLLSLIASILIVLAGCAPSNELGPISQIPGGVASEGSLANDKLSLDAEVGLSQIAQRDGEIYKFVIQQPVGTVGRMAWREMWIIEVAGQSSSYIMTFREDGEGGATFEINQM